MAKQANPVRLQEYKQKLREAGLRATAARVSVLQQLTAAQQPVSHADMVDALGAFGFDQSTLFRVLTELSEAGLVNRLDLGDQIRRFELRGAPGAPEFDHAHFLCTECGKIQCLEGYRFRLTPPRSGKLPGEITEVLFKGRCAKCDE